MSIPYASGDPLTCQQLRELDILAIEHVGLPGAVLMENAAREAAAAIHGWLMNPAEARVFVLCGPGDNGGDGLAIARHLCNAGVSVTAALAAEASRVEGDAAMNLGVFQRMGGDIIAAHTPIGLARLAVEIAEADLIVDALLGTGASGPPRGVIAELIDLANASQRARRVAIDVPTGLDADRGVVADPCFVADATVTFVATKTGFDAPAARRVLGRVLVVDIGVPRGLIPGRTKSETRP